MLSSPVQGGPGSARQLAAAVFIKKLFVPQQDTEGRVRVMTPFSQTKKGRCGEMRCLAPNHEVGKRWGFAQDPSLSSLLAPRVLV